MTDLPKPPDTYRRFSETHPKLRKAWDQIGEAGRDGPLDERTARLIKLAMAMATMSEGAVHSNVRKALATGITPEEIQQVVALACSSMGLPSTVAVWTWIEDVLRKE
ncbi:MAG: carboxymuconolactone decarboxylase family protein [Thermoanaerobaculia bacterium]|nr:carboxymuconolactone decarboxylase family protein [Thermoanaerobaculia bacterium]